MSNYLNIYKKILPDRSVELHKIAVNFVSYKKIVA